jgi:hypothetical protein
MLMKQQGPWLSLHKMFDIAATCMLRLGPMLRPSSLMYSTPTIQALIQLSHPSRRDIKSKFILFDPFRRQVLLNSNIYLRIFLPSPRSIHPPRSSSQLKTVHVAAATQRKNAVIIMTKLLKTSRLAIRGYDGTRIGTGRFAIRTADGADNVDYRTHGSLLRELCDCLG